jgi:hypothetical protein
VHYREYTKGEIERLLSWAGFTIAESRTAYFYREVGWRRVAKATVGLLAPGASGNLFVVGAKKS